jgi:hypothetical protein
MVRSCHKPLNIQAHFNLVRTLLPEAAQPVVCVGPSFRLEYQPDR